MTKDEREKVSKMTLGFLMWGTGQTVVVTSYQGGPRDLVSWHSRPCGMPSYNELWLAWMTNKIPRNLQCLPYETESGKVLQHPPFGSLALEGANHYVMRTLKQLSRTLCNGPCKEELRSPTNRQHQLARHRSEPSWKWDLPSPFKPSSNCSPGQHLACELRRHFETAVS